MEKADKRENIVMIASEPLTFQKEDWIEVPSQTCLVITPRVSRSLLSRADRVLIAV